MYYVFDDGKNKFEGMTREQIMAAIAQATGTTPSDVDDGYITTIKEQNENQGISIWVGTQAQYNALAETDENTLYCITDPNETNELQNEIDLLRAQIAEISTQGTEIANGIAIFTQKASVTLDPDEDYYKHTFTVPSGYVLLEASYSNTNIGANHDWNTDDIHIEAGNTSVTVTKIGSFGLDADLKIVYAAPSQAPLSLPELIDIRVGADGYTYASAGEAVRNQILELQTQGSVENLVIGENLINSVLPTSYYLNCRGKGTALAFNVLADASSRFRVNLTETLKANENYVLSFTVSGCGNTRPRLYMLYATAASSSVSLGEVFTIQDGGNIVRFTPSADGIYPRILLTNYDLSGREAQDNILFSDFKLERGNARTAFIPSADAADYYAKIEKWQKVQDRVYNEAANQFPLFFVSGKTEPNITGNYNEYSAYQPTAIYSWARKEMSIVANFKASAAISDEDIILTGLPTIYNNIRIYNAVSWIYNGNLCSANLVYTNDNYEEVSTLPSTGTSGKCYCLVSSGTKTFYVYESGAWVRRYVPCGVLKFDVNSNDSVRTIAADSLVRIEARPIPMSTQHGTHRFPTITADDITNACDWLAAHRGLYDYSNNGRWRRKRSEDSTQPYAGLGATDCAGIIHQAFRYGAGKFVPDGSKSQVGFGKIIAFARKGELLDLSAMQEGDIVGFLDIGDGDTWAVNHVAIAVRGRLTESPNDTDLHLWNVSSSYPQEFESNANYYKRVIAQYKNEPYDSNDRPNDKRVFGPQPVEGTYSDGVYATDEFKSCRWDARILLRWTDDYADLDSDFA